MISGEALVQCTATGLLLGCVYALAAAGFSIIFGVIRIPNFAHGELVLVGMYATFMGYKLFGIDPYLSLIVVLLLSFLLGYLIYRGVFSHSMKASHESQLLLAC